MNEKKKSGNNFITNILLLVIVIFLASFSLMMSYSSSSMSSNAKLIEKDMDQVERQFQETQSARHELKGKADDLPPKEVDDPSP